MCRFSSHGVRPRRGDVNFGPAQEPDGGDLLGVLQWSKAEGLCLTFFVGLGLRASLTTQNWTILHRRRSLF